MGIYSLQVHHILCDSGKCPTRFDASEVSLKEFIEQIKALGWHNLGNKWVCPDCAKKRRSIWVRYWPGRDWK